MSNQQPRREEEVAPFTGRIFPESAFATDLHALGHTPSCRVYNSANISINDVTWTALTFDSERWDNDDIHGSANTRRLIAPVTGVYQITGNVKWASNANGNRQVRIMVNDATDIAHTMQTIAGAGARYMSITTLYNLAFGEYVTLDVYQNSGGAINVENASNTSPEFMMVKVAEAGEL